MLIITRKPGQQILMDNGRIQLKITKINGNNTSIGIIAPLDMDISREEVFSQSLAQEKLASLNRGA